MGVIHSGHKRELDPFQKEANRLWKLLYNESPPVRMLDEEVIHHLDVSGPQDNLMVGDELSERGKKVSKDERKRRAIRF